MKQIVKLELGWRSWAVFTGFGMLLVALTVLWAMDSGLSDLKAAWDGFDDFMTQNPWAIFWALVVLPGLPFPTSALLVIAGVVWKDQPVMACVVCMTAIAANMTWTYWLGAGIGRGAIVRLLALTKYKLPEFGRESDLRMILILRLVPGFPLFLQNYMLGLLHVPFRLYLPISVVCNGVMACGVILGSAGIAGANFMPMVTGIALIVVAVVVIHALKQKLRLGRTRVE